MILYVLIILVLASFVFAFLGARTWHWGYVLLVEAIFLASVGFFIFAAETLRINGVYRAQINKSEKELANLNADVDALRNGTKDGGVLNRLRAGETPAKMAEDADSIPSLEDMDHELLIATRRRGRVWRNVTPAGVDPKTGNVKITITSPTPAGIKGNSVVYLFEEGPPQQPGPNGPRSPQYLGEFNVVQAAGQSVTLTPTVPLQPTDPESRRVAASKGPWTMYETMPADRYEIYAGMTDDQLKQLLPKQSVNEFLKNGKPATADDDPWRKFGYDENGQQLPADQMAKATKILYERRLRDYAVEIDELLKRRISMLADVDAVKKDIDELTAAEEVGKKLQAFRTEERQKLATDLAGVTKEREAIEKHLAQVEQLLAKARQLTAETMAHNEQLVAELAARQLHTQPSQQRHQQSPKTARTAGTEPLEMMRPVPFDAAVAYNDAASLRPFPRTPPHRESPPWDSTTATTAAAITPATRPVSTSAAECAPSRPTSFSSPLLFSSSSCSPAATRQIRKWAFLVTPVGSPICSVFIPICLPSPGTSSSFSRMVFCMMCGTSDTSFSIWPRSGSSAELSNTGTASESTWRSICWRLLREVQPGSWAP